MNKWAFPKKYGSLVSAHYKGSGNISITPSEILPPESILGSIRWTNAEYAAVLTSYGIQIGTSTGLSAVGLIGMGIVKLNSYTVEDTGGTDVTEYFGEKSLSLMPDITGVSARFLQNATGPMIAGTRDVGNFLYTTIAYASTQAGISQSNNIVDLTTGDNEPVFLLANEGLEYRNTFSLPADKNMQINIVAGWSCIPVEVVRQFYGIS